ncbi:hypothetical protein Csa_001511 [Cucumis sativus]|nr:hypothetical protein Csa_001511 [Cucumis sativus]
MNRLAPLSEEPIDEHDARTRTRNRNRTTAGAGGGGRSWRNWIRTHFSILSSAKKSDGLNVLLSVLGCPLFPVSLQPNSAVSITNQVPLPFLSSLYRFRLIKFKYTNKHLS